MLVIPVPLKQLFSDLVHNASNADKNNVESTRGKSLEIISEIRSLTESNERLSKALSNVEQDFENLANEIQGNGIARNQTASTVFQTNMKDMLADGLQRLGEELQDALPSDEAVERNKDW